MQYRTYQQRVLGRASHRWHNEKLDTGDLAEVLDQFIYWGTALDSIKKALMYGRDFVQHPGQTPLAVNAPLPTPSEQDQLFCHAILGAATEGVELVEAMREFFFGESRRFDPVNLQEEFGDMEWYRALGLYALGQTHEANLEQNNAKLELRFGKIFTEQAANSRDLTAERKLLEGEISPVSRNA